MQKNTDLAQQYSDQSFENTLNKTEAISSNTPRSFATFSQQAEQVVINSPSLATKYQHLYEQLNNWVLQSGRPEDLAGYGVQSAQLGGGG